MANQQRWIIKDEMGRVQGPLTTAQVLHKISSGDFTGDELISPYPGNDWYPISQDPQFYDKLLDVLSGGVEDIEAEIEDEIQERLNEDTPEESNVAPPKEDLDATIPNVTFQRQLKEKAAANKANATQQEDADLEVESDKTPTITSHESVERRKSKRGSKSDPKSKKRSKSKGKKSRGNKKQKRRRSKKYDDIELKEQKRLDKNLRRKASSVPTLIFVSLLAALVVWFFWPSSHSVFKRIHLRFPDLTAESNPASAGKYLKRALGDFVVDEFEYYRQSEGNIIKSLQADPTQVKNWSFLCLAHLELWPYSHMNEDDVATIMRVNQKLSQLAGDSIDSYVCKLVHLIVNGRESEANSLATVALQVAASQNDSSSFALYYLKARAITQKSEINTALGYLQTAESQWPDWLRLKTLKAELYEKQNRYNQAASVYQQVVTINPQHKASWVNLGIIQFKKFNQIESAYKTLKAAMAMPTKIPSQLTARGYVNLSELSLRYENTKEALKYAKQAYAYNPSDPIAKNLVTQLGGANSVKGQDVDLLQLISEGDLLYKQGDMVSALAHYKTAHELNPKSAVAALKAAKCAWNLSFSNAAIGWLNAAIKADYKYVDAYVLLADYHAQRYEFATSAKILSKASKVAKRNYEVYLGMALVEYRRQNPKGSIGYAKQSLKLFSGDVRTYVLMAKSYIMMNEFNEALSAATSALELDINNNEAHIQFAKAKAFLEGVDPGIYYMQQLIRSYPSVLAYRLALAEMYHSDERYADAEILYQQVLEIKDKSKEAILGLASTYKAQGKSSEALNAYLQAAVMDPSDAQALFEAALLYLQSKKFREAKAQFQRVLGINKKYPLVHYYMGQAALLSKDYKEAISQAKQERVLNPNLPESYTLAAEAYYKMGQYSLCSREYQKAIKLQPQGAQSFVSISRCYRLAGNLEIAIQMLNQAAKLESGLAEIYKEQGAVYETRGEAQFAIKAYEKYLALEPGAPDRNVIRRRIVDLSNN